MMTEAYGGSVMIAAPKGVAAKLKEILAAAKIEPSAVCCSGEEALEAELSEGSLLLTTWQLPDMTGMELARRMGEETDVLMIIPQDCEETLANNVMALRNPISQEVLIQSVRVIQHCSVRARALRARVQKLSRTLEERKTIERAKGKLMEIQQLTEAEAHYRMQKLSMDTGRRIVEIAEDILAGIESHNENG